MAKTYHACRSTLLSTTDPEKLNPTCVTNILIFSTQSVNKCNDNMSFISHWLKSCFEPDEKQLENHPILFQHSNSFHQFTPTLLTIPEQDSSTIKHNKPLKIRYRKVNALQLNNVNPPRS